MIEKLELKHDGNKLTQAFNKYDTNGNGILEKKELRAMLGSIGFAMTSSCAALLRVVETLYQYDIVFALKNKTQPKTKDSYIVIILHRWQRGSAAAHRLAHRRLWPVAASRRHQSPAGRPSFDACN
jgi:hypothetical protein